MFVLIKVLYSAWLTGFCMTVYKFPANIFLQTLKEYLNSIYNVSFDTFCAKIGPSVTPKLVFKVPWVIDLFFLSIKDVRTSDMNGFSSQ